MNENKDKKKFNWSPLIIIFGVVWIIGAAWYVTQSEYDKFQLKKREFRHRDMFSLYTWTYPNDTNTNVYLRQINEKLDRLCESLEKTSKDVKDQKQLVTDGEEAACMIDFSLEQLGLLNSGKLLNGLWTALLPNFLTNDTSLEFDLYNCMILETYALKNNPKEVVNIIEHLLPRRTESAETIKMICLKNIERQLHDYIRFCVEQTVVAENNCIVPKDLWYLVSNRISFADEKKLEEQIMLKVKAGEIKGSCDIAKFVRKQDKSNASYYKSGSTL